MRKFVLLFSVLIFLFSCQKESISPISTYSVNVIADSIHFAIIGDYGKEGDPAKEVSEMIKSWNPDFIITLGDNNYESGTLSSVQDNIAQYYCDFIYNPDAPEAYRCEGKAKEEQVNRFFPCLGNHDQYNANFSQPFLSYFTLPGKETYYTFTWGPAQFFILNSGKDGEASCCESEQAMWLKNVLSTSTSQFKIVYFHHPPFSTSHHSNIENMQWPFKAWGADIILSGHSHLYERISLKSDPDFYYVVNGLGGNPTRHTCNTVPLNTDHFNHFCYNDNFGAIKAKATQSSLQLDFISINDPSLILDQIILEK